MNNNQSAQMYVRFPAPKQESQPIVIVKEGDKKCGKRCCPKLDTGCCNTYASDLYDNQWCNSVGITGLLHKKPCMQFDELYGSGCAPCIGCDDKCDRFDMCRYRNPY